MQYPVIHPLAGYYGDKIFSNSSKHELWLRFAPILNCQSRCSRIIRNRSTPAADMWRIKLEQEIRWHFTPRKSLGSRAEPERRDNEPESDLIDIRGPDGLFQKGRTVDCVKGGLMIAWDCEGSVTHFVPFGNIYLSRAPRFLKRDVVFPGKVEVLMRQSPQLPKTWYPGELIAGELTNSACQFGCQFGLVRINTNLSGDENTVIVPWDRIRDPLTTGELDTLRVHKGHFVKHRVYLPKMFSHGSDFARQMVNALNRESGGRTERTRILIRAIRMDDKSLTCMRIGYDIVPKEQQYHTADHLRPVLLRAARDCITPQNQPKKRKLSQTELENSASANTEPVIISSAFYGLQLLPQHILATVFQQFDSTEQCRLRRVCASWDCILTLPCVARVLRVRYEKNEHDWTGRQPTVQNWKSVASVHQGWTPQTRTIVNAGVDTGAYPLLCGGQLLQTFIEKGLHDPVERVVLANAAWTVKGHAPDGFARLCRRLVDDLNEITAVCQKLVLYNVKIQVHSRVWLMRPTFLHITTGSIASVLTVTELWARMDDSFPSLATSQGQQLSAWISSSMQGKEDAQRGIINILNDRQSSDPRESAHYRRRKWTAAELATLEPEKLNRITLYSLVALRDSTSLTIALSW